MSFVINLCFLQRRWYSKGYTLIEVLIGISIFSIMMMLAGVALDQTLKQYHRLAEKGLGFWEDAKKLWLDKSLNSTIDYYVYTRADGWFPYFKGNPEGISFVSLSPLVGELPVVVWLRSQPEENGERSLIYYELPIYTKSYEEIERNEIFGDYKRGASLKLLEGVEKIEFSFYGYDLKNRCFNWYNQFDGKRMRILPSTILLSYYREGKMNKLFWGINVNSMAKTIYNDIYLK